MLKALSHSTAGWSRMWRFCPSRSRRPRWRARCAMCWIALVRLETSTTALRRSSRNDLYTAGRPHISIQKDGRSMVDEQILSKTKGGKAKAQKLKTVRAKELQMEQQTDASISEYQATIERL